MLPAASIDASLREIRRRYADDDEYHAELARVGLDVPSLYQAVARDLVVEAVLEKVAARLAPVSDTDVEIFWYINRHRFRHGETRLLRHLLVTSNEGLAGVTSGWPRARIDAIHARLLKEPQRFAEQALKHSECPTAVHGGLLGRVPRGQLYPQLDAVAFALAEGSLSEVIESELGYHLNAMCDFLTSRHDYWVLHTRSQPCPSKPSSSPSMAISARLLRSLCLAEIPAVGDFRQSYPMRRH